MCCKGCQAVALAIVAGGMKSYYQYRTEKSATAKELIPDALRQAEVYDREEMQRSFVRQNGENIRGQTMSGYALLTSLHRRNVALINRGAL